MMTIICVFDLRHVRAKKGKIALQDIIMKLYISKDADPEDIKSRFSACYPFLKIELYKQELRNDTFNKGDLPIARQFTGLPKEGFIHIDPGTTVAQLEHSFEIFGLKSRVFRRSGNFWIGTLLTSNLTLQQQNSAGEEITNQY